jgi:hypothetical protein
LLIDGEPTYQYLAGDRVIRACQHDIVYMSISNQPGLEVSRTPHADENEPAAWGKGLVYLCILMCRCHLTDPSYM